MGNDRSLKSSVDATDKINDIRLSLNSDEGSKIVWILVEGEDDCKIYPKFFDKTAARVEFVNGGKGQLTIALQAFETTSNRVIGIQDADFSHIDNTYSSLTNLFYTDFHDIEMTMLSFDDVRLNLFTEYQLQAQIDAIWQNVLNEASSYVGYIRWYNETMKCSDVNFKGINFAGMNYGALATVALPTITLNKPQLLVELNQRSNRSTQTTSNEIDAFIATHPTSDLLNLCNGHDVTKMLSLIVGGIVSPKGLCKDLRLSFQNTHFVQTELYAEIYNWQNQHGYRIL